MFKQSNFIFPIIFVLIYCDISKLFYNQYSNIYAKSSMIHFKPNIIYQSFSFGNKNNSINNIKTINDSNDNKQEESIVSNFISSLFPKSISTHNKRRSNHNINLIEKIPQFSKSIEEVITIHEMANELDKASDLLNKSSDQIVRLGWKLVHKSPGFSLYKRKELSKGPSIYLMLGQFKDISARNFLFSQISNSHRTKWDTTMKDMKSITDSVIDPKMESSEDILYFRTKWPWPLKDRDYILARRTFSFPNKNAIVFASKSTESIDLPSIKDVIRVDNYYCYSTIFANQYYKHENINTLHSPESSKYSSNVIENSKHKIKNKLGLGFTSRIKEISNHISKDIRHHSSDLKHSIENSFRFLDRYATDNMSSKNVISTTNKVISGLDLPGMSFVTVFCDDQRVPLPRTVVDLLSKYAEKLVPESTSRLHDVAMTLETFQNNQ